jgi:hypothetical protein
MALEGKISITHYLNKKLAPDNGRYPLYIRIKFQNKDARIKSRVTYFEKDNPLDPLSVVKLYSEQQVYYSESEFIKRKELINQEAEFILMVMDAFRNMNINILEDQPSLIIDKTLSSFRNLMDTEFRQRLKGLIKENGFNELLTMVNKYNPSFSLTFKTIQEIGTDQAIKKLISPMKNHYLLIQELGKLRVGALLSQAGWDIFLHSFLNQTFDKQFALEMETLINKKVAELFAPIKIKDFLKQKTLIKSQKIKV